MDDFQQMAVGAEDVLAMVERVLECFPQPEQLPRRPPNALEPHVHAEARERAARGEEAQLGPLIVTADWLHRCEQVRQRNRSALSALLWAAHQVIRQVPAAERGTAPMRLLETMIGAWGLRADVPPTLVGCRKLGNAYQTPQWGELNRRV